MQEEVEVVAVEEVAVEVAVLKVGSARLHLRMPRAALGMDERIGWARQSGRRSLI